MYIYIYVGRVGITIDTGISIAETNSVEDMEAAERSMEMNVIIYIRDRRKAILVTSYLFLVSSTVGTRIQSFPTKVITRR